MVGLESSMDNAENAKGVWSQKAAESDAEKARQKAFYAKLRARDVEQPKGDEE